MLGLSHLAATHMTKPNQQRIDRVSWFESKSLSGNILESNAGGRGVGRRQTGPATFSFLPPRIQKGLEDEHRRHLVDDLLPR